MSTIMSETTPIKFSSGFPYPFGATIYSEGVNFSVVSVHAKNISLSIFSRESPPKLLHKFSLDPIANKTGDVWHIFLHNPPADFLYLYHVDDVELALLDPYAKEVTTTNVWGENREQGYHPFGGVPSPNSFSWDDIKPPAIPLEDLIIYEMHVRGFTHHHSSHVEAPGTFLGVIEKIPYLLDLGVNAIELLPIHEFNECENVHKCPFTKQFLFNYWGYSTVNFFAPMQRYASSMQKEAAINEFKTMVKELHRNGIEVILDVVYNHTAEGNEKGPIYSFKGFDTPIYYMLDKSQKHFLNFSGCGNTFNCNHPTASELIISSLRYWVTEMHVDGFRFDLASILTRGTNGEPIDPAPLIEEISKDPILAKVKLIAEPWDAAGMYQVGSFYTYGDGRWSEWNGKYRDTMRQFMKGTGSKSDFGTKLCGSQDLYYSGSPANSINFIIAHDGFTLMDLVSYSKKHNFGNGENNADGDNNNNSWNCGVEGTTLNKSVIAIRERQIRNFHLALMISRGVPMILMGDEYGHTKHGNNNTWCQDNDLNWFLWDQLEKNHGFNRFYKGLIHFRKKNAILRENKFIESEDIDWHGQKLLQPNWSLQDHLVAFTLKDPKKVNHLYVAFNSGPNKISVDLPTQNDSRLWRWIVNTSQSSPNDFHEENDYVAVTETTYQMQGFSAIMLQATTTT